MYTYRLCSLDSNTTCLSQLCSIEHSMYVYWSIFSFDHLVRKITVSYRSGLAPISLLLITRTWPLFARTSKNQVRFLLQLSVHSSCDLVEWYRLQTTRRPFLPLGEWFRVLPSDVGGCPVSPVYIPQHLHFYARGGSGGVYHLLSSIW